ncbi:MAG: dethiobiotin synthase [Proteobacteria bacterium]|nr:dethiobiotin synthase [Pseudomonadota bacterium]
MSLSLFVTGTDTGCGKTRISCALLEALSRAGVSATGMKPVATGALRSNGLLVQEDVKALVAASNVAIPRRYVNPYLFVPPCSPNIAAQQANTAIELAVIEEAFDSCQSRAEAVVVEGVGGWCVPLGDNLWLEDLALRLKLPVLLVVGIRLGCINHAVLSARAIIESGLPLLGWIANVVDPHTIEAAAVINTITRHLDAPRLAVLDYAPGASAAHIAPQLGGCVDALRRQSLS